MHGCPEFLSDLLPSIDGLFLGSDTNRWDGSKLINLPSGGSHNILSAAHLDTVVAAVIAGDLIYGNATPKWARLAKGTDGQYLKLETGLPSWADPPAAADHNLLSSVHPDTLVAAVVRGDIIVGNATPKWAKLALTANRILKSGALDVAWGLIVNADVDAAAGIIESKLALNYPTHARSHDHSNTLDGSPIAVGGVPDLPATKITSLRLALARLPDGALNYVLKAGGVGVDPAWGQIAHTELTGILADQHHDKVHGDAEHTPAYEKTANKGVVSGYCDLDASVEVPLTRIKATLTGKDVDTVDTYHAAALEKVANKGVASGYADLDASAKVPAARMPTGTVKTTLSFAVVGTLTTGNDKAPTILAPCSLTVTKVKLVVKTAPTGAAIIVDVNKNGTTIFTTQANRPQIAIGATTGDSGTPDVTALVEGDKLTIDVDQVGSTVAGADLTVEVVTNQTVVFS